MSLAMRQARMYAVGDPGLFGFLGKVGKGLVGAATGFVTGGPGGAIAGAARAFIPPRAMPGVGMVPAQSPMVSTRTQPMFPVLAAQSPQFSGRGFYAGPGGVAAGSVQYGPGGPGTAVQQRTTGAVVGAGAGTPCTSGYHYNKSAYYTKRYGVIEKGTVCVKNRRRNPLNPRALSRSMSRIKSAQKAVRCLGLFAGAPARAAAKGRFGRAKGKSCGRGCKR